MNDRAKEIKPHKNIDNFISISLLPSRNTNMRNANHEKKSPIIT